MKSLLSKLFPKSYHFLWSLKEALRTHSFNRRWNGYYEGTAPDDWMLLPVPELTTLKLPAHVDTMLDIGCASGRNFIPFDGKLKLWGIDIVPEWRIKWVRPFRNLRYDQMTCEQLTKWLERERPDMSHVFVFESASFMYVPAEWQQRFFDICRALGCKNFMFRDYPPDSTVCPEENIKLSLEGFTTAIDTVNPQQRIYTMLET